jgi:serine/threonine protein kinase
VASRRTMLGQGDMIAGYRIDSLIGSGGMATVYRAEQVSLGRHVALKLLSMQLGQDEAFRERFRREGKHAAALHHANVVTIFDSGEVAGQLFMAMQLIEGSTLAELLAKGPISADKTVSLLAPIGDALDAAHSLGLVHRDVKPQNILLDQSGHPYLADFGIAKTSASSAALTATGGFIGSLNYAAPEQICGERITAAVDVYAFTAVLYQCLTGEVPYVRETDASVMYAHLNDPPPRLPEQSPQSIKLNQIIARGMAKNPSDRYLRASEVISDTGKLIARMDYDTRHATPLFPLDDSIDSQHRITVLTSPPARRPNAGPHGREPDTAHLRQAIDQHETERVHQRSVENTRIDRRPVIASGTSREATSRSRRNLFLIAAAVLAVAVGLVAALTLPTSKAPASRVVAKSSSSTTHDSHASNKTAQGSSSLASGSHADSGLAPLEMASPGGYNVLVPADWRYERHSTEGRTTDLWVGPDPHESLRIVLSSCSTCATNQGEPSARAVGLPAGTISSFDISKSALGYQAYIEGNPNPDNGIIVVTSNGATITGYAQVDLWLASGLHSSATRILNSFSLLHYARH